MTAMDDQDLNAIVGCTDGFRQGYIEGWAWWPNRPHDTVVVQLLVDGALAGEVSACLPRPDLTTAGIGHGQHAFAIPLVIEPDSPSMLHLTVRAKDGPVLPSGEIDFATSEDTRAELARRRSVDHLEKVFGAFTANGPQPPRRLSPEPVPRLNFVLYATRGQAAASAILGAPEYSYVFVMHGFRDLLRQMGVVHVVHDPAAADDIYRDCLDRGESCLLFSFTPPQNTPLGLRCPTIPVIAWEFGSIPTGGWLGDVREDWRYVLRQTGRAITISAFAAKAIRATMGAAYPVAFIPTPVWDRQSSLRARLTGPGAITPGGPATLHFDGFTWDSRRVTLSADMRAPSPPVIAERLSAPVLPMRGAQLALAEASAAEQLAIAQALSQESARLAAIALVEQEAEAQRILQQAAEEASAQLEEAERILHQAAEEAAAARDAEAMRIAGEQALREAETQAAVGVLSPEPAAPPKTFGRRMRITAFLARQWYREVIRDMLPAPVARGLSTAGRVVLGGRPAMPQASAGAPHHETGSLRAQVFPEIALDGAAAPATAIDCSQEAVAPEMPVPGLPEATLGGDAIETAMMSPAEEELPPQLRECAASRLDDNATMPAADTALPPTALYLPVGNPENPEPATAPPRYLPAQDKPPLPEPALANFIPDPYPSAEAAGAERATATIDGLIFTAVLSPKDGRKNWQDILTAFTTVFRDTPEATLVLKMVGSDPAFWWWEFHGIAKALPHYSCRVLVINGFLDDENYAKLIAATHFVVNASLAEGQCLPLVEFMSAGRPAIAPLHTAMLDYITQDNALIVASDVEFCSFPHDPRNMLITTRHRIEWPSLCAALAECASIVDDNPARYSAMAEKAASAMRAYCSDETAGSALAGFLGFGDDVLKRAGWRPLSRVAAERLLAPPQEMYFSAADGQS